LIHPVITEVAPPSLPTTLAGLPIVVQGSGFTGIGSVLFGGITVDFAVLTPNIMMVTTTPHTAGRVALTVSGQGGSTTLSNAFTYFVLPAPAK
jgi:IPT/TIG domain